VQLRLAAVGLLGTLLRQGMLCPLDVMGQLVALQGDEEPVIRREALKLVQVPHCPGPGTPPRAMDSSAPVLGCPDRDFSFLFFVPVCWWQLEDEKHPTFLDNRLLEGVELCYLFQVPGVRFLGSPVIINPLSRPLSSPLSCPYKSTCRSLLRTI